MTRRVLLVDDDKAVREALGQTLELAELEPVPAGSFVAAKDHITRDFDGVILSDIRMPGRDGFHLLDYAQKQDTELPVVLLTGEGDIPMAVQAMGQGAFDFLEKPCGPQDLVPVLERALRTRALVLENRHLRAQVQRGDPAARMLFGVSEAADALRQRVRRVAQGQTHALVVGPPGSGIPKVAEVIHLCAPQSKGPFVKTAGRDLSVADLRAARDAAQGGALFIDEAAQMPGATQLALNEALDEDPSMPRLLVGASGDLEAEAACGAFNPDLYYRLAAVVVRIPALAERREDIPVLFRHYVAQAGEQAGLTPPEITPEVLSGLMARDWPGNARALMSEAMQFALGLREDTSVPAAGLGLAEQMAQVEKTLLEDALRRAGGRAAQAAQALKLPRKTLYDKLARHGIRTEAFRDA